VESKELRLNISELEANTNDLHAKFEAALAHLEQESEQKDAEIEALNQTIEKLSEQIYLLEDENDRIKEDSDRQREDDAVERERLEALTAALKEVCCLPFPPIPQPYLTAPCLPQKISTLKAQLQETTELYETYSNEIHAHRSRQEELARHVEDLVDEAQRERQARERAESELEAADREHDAELRSQRRLLSDKDGALQNAVSELARTQGLLAQREGDMQAVQSSLQTLEVESKRLGETHTTARFSLQLETDRLKRDLERVEDELGRARKELQEREGRGREREGALDGLHTENRDLKSQLAAQTQARLNVAEKLDKVQRDLRAAETEAGAMKGRVGELETRLSKDQRALLGAESQYRDQLTERNTLLLTIYQYMDKILGVDNTPVGGC
jgi:chromosome segregation ATPase